MYPFLFRHVLTRLDPEQAHHLAFLVIQAIPALKLDRLVARFTHPATDLSVQALGLTFRTPFGVAAGFDKDAKGIKGLCALGFGHVEVGTITARAQPGNPRPRLFRLVPDRAVINRMGFNNGGAAEASLRLARVRSSRGAGPVVGVNIGKSRVVDVDDAVGDYLQSARALAPMADYLVVNVSSPNTPGLRGLQELDKLAPLLSAVKAEAGRTPLLVKIAPDLSDDEVVKISTLAVELGLDGIIATNTTISRSGLTTDPAVVEAAGAGGLSGAPLAARALEVLRIIRGVVPESLCVISVGGVDTAADVDERLRAGATLVQGYTAFLYRGPLWARGINRGLARIRRR
ncbi:quinone-dependent dihydroorotate dehydrogenase [Herbiconiux moechotypicola]|uniref:Dihydroorotate dehydrogenase (quinone) n=1 Tax=Herbiconiux moechotypicola TaxID=637393 RepID=A0ABN3E571_9MICO|nr:quinone-dependent dihydroorotate dehydrogenase [Herbiconiux moechotypicola]MCS5731850.1 quinone-dependent dihydroorotate dehydrogenase [Herbiconiux moechotypicola]